MPVPFNDPLIVNTKADGALLANDVLNTSRAVRSAYTQVLLLIGQMNHLADGINNTALGTRLGMNPLDAAALYTELNLLAAQLNTAGDEPGAQLMFRVVG